MTQALWGCSLHEFVDFERYTADLVDLPDDPIFLEPSEDDLGQIDLILDKLAWLPPREADIIELYYVLHLKQQDIARIFGVSQPTICYRLARAQRRIWFLINLPEVSLQKMEDDLSRYFSDALDVQILVLMCKTTCQSEVAKRLNVTQGLVRHRFYRSLSRMRYVDKFFGYVALFEFISNNLNILREVHRKDEPLGNEVHRCLL